MQQDIRDWHLALVLFKIFINEQEAGISSTSTTEATDGKLGSVVVDGEGSEIISRKLERVEISSGNQMSFDLDKCSLIYL